MPAFAIGSELFGEMFGREAMRTLFADRAMVQRYLDVEVALARAQAGLGIIPQAAAEAIAASANIERIDWERLRARTAIVGSPILPLVEQLSGWAPEGLGQWCHWGATTQDIMDTARRQLRPPYVVCPNYTRPNARTWRFLPVAGGHGEQPACWRNPPFGRRRALTPTRSFRQVAPTRRK